MAPGCLGAFASTLIGGVIGVLTLGFDGLSILLVVFGMWAVWAVAGGLVAAIGGFREMTPLTEAVGALCAGVPWLGLWLVAELVSHDTAFMALAIADGLAVLGFVGLCGYIFVRYWQSGGRFRWLGGYTRREWSFDIDGARHSVEVENDSFWSGLPRDMVFDATGIPIRWRRVSPVWSYWSARHEFTFQIAGRAAILRCERRSPPLADRLKIAIGGFPKGFFWGFLAAAVTGSTGASGGAAAASAAEDIDETSHLRYRLLIGGRDLGPPRYSEIPLERHVPTLQEHLAGGAADDLSAIRWTRGLAETVRQVHELLALALSPKAARFVILDQFKAGRTRRTLIQLSPYDGRLYFRGRGLSEAGLRLVDLQARARAAGIPAAGTWISLPEAEPARGRLLELLGEIVQVASSATTQAAEVDKESRHPR